MQHELVRVDLMAGNMKVFHCKCGGKIYIKIKTLRIHNLTNGKLILRREACIISSDCAEGLRDKSQQKYKLISEHV